MIPQTNKQPGRYIPKQSTLEVKDVDEKKGIVSGYASAFGIIDSDRDIIEAGAFRQSIQMKGPNSPGNRKIAYLRNHDFNRQIGKLLELEEDSYGLKFVAQLGTSDEGRNAFQDYKEQILREHSIGFVYVADKMFYDEKQDAYIIKEVNLWEISAVTFGANPFTNVLSVSEKSADKRQSFEQELYEEGQQIAKMLAKSDLTPERKHTIEGRLRLHNSKILYYLEQLKALQPSVKGTEGSKPARNEPDFLTLILSKDGKEIR